MTSGTAFMRGQLVYAKGQPCILNCDPVMVAALHGVDNCNFARLQQCFISGYDQAKEIATDLRTPTY